MASRSKTHCQGGSSVVISIHSHSLSFTLIAYVPETSVSGLFIPLCGYTTCILPMVTTTFLILLLYSFSPQYYYYVSSLLCHSTLNVSHLHYLYTLLRLLLDCYYTTMQLLYDCINMLYVLFSPWYHIAYLLLCYRLSVVAL